MGERSTKWNVNEFRYNIGFVSTRKRSAPAPHHISQWQPTAKLYPFSGAGCCRHLPVIRFVYPSKCVHQKGISEHTERWTFRKNVFRINNSAFSMKTKSGYSQGWWALSSDKGITQISAWNSQRKFITSSSYFDSLSRTHPPTKNYNALAALPRSDRRLMAKWRKMNLNHFAPIPSLLYMRWECAKV